MIRMKLYGGLGNQMFQYAFIRSIANKRNCLFQVDVSNYFSTGEGDAVDLLQLNVPAEVFFSRAGSKRNLFVLRALKKLGVKRIGPVYIEIMPDFSEEAINSSCDFFFGYFQSYRYFHQYRENLINEFTFSKVKNSSYYSTIKETESVGIHVRRGDYISDKKVSRVMSELDPAYYTAAAKKILSIIKKPVHFFIFSNDPGWVEQKLLPRLAPFGKYTVVDHNLEPRALYDFECLKNCKHQIIANSTFSWWAGYLNNYANKKIVAPATWYRKWNLQLRNFYPPDFIVLS
jgi:hypothetical protein